MEALPITPFDALQCLKQGNKRFVNRTPLMKPVDENELAKLASGQTPYAVVLTCSDSRLSPEIIFDTSFNELFVLRNIGNIVTEVEMAAVEYAVGHLGVTFILILGHDNCGAVKFAREAASGHEEVSGPLKTVFNEIAPYISGSGDISSSEDNNISHSASKFLSHSSLKRLLDEKGAQVCRAKYHISTGVVDFLDDLN